MLAIRQLPSPSMLRGLVAGKLMSGTGLHVEYTNNVVSAGVLISEHILYS